MDKTDPLTRLVDGAEKLGIRVPSEAFSGLLWLVEELGRWNRKVNLTAIDDPVEAIEKHILDSLVVSRYVASGQELLDIGAGAGFPGLPLKLLSPERKVTLVETVAKKVAFIKHVIAQRKLADVRALHARATGKPESDGIPKADVVVSRALMDFEDWISLAAPYVAREGRLLAMLGRDSAREVLEGAARRQECELERVDTYILPFSGAQRAIAVVRPQRRGAMPT